MTINDIILIVGLAIVFYILFFKPTQEVLPVPRKKDKEIEEISKALEYSWEEWATLASTTNEAFNYMKEKVLKLENEVQTLKDRLDEKESLND